MDAAATGAREPLEFERGTAGENAAEVARKMPMYHVELKDGTQISRSTKTELDDYLSTIDFDDVRRMYKGHELKFKRCAFVVME